MKTARILDILGCI